MNARWDYDERFEANLKQTWINSSPMERDG